MNKYIAYKEWKKTARPFLLILVFSLLAFTIELVKMYVAARELGHLYLWQVFILKNVVPFSSLKSIPILIGILLGWAQFAPELSKQTLKLSLHLPLSHRKILFDMLLMGIFEVFIICAIIFGIFLVATSFLFPIEVIMAWFWTSIPMIGSAVVSYLLIVWIMLEPKWGTRVANIVITLSVFIVFYLSDLPMAYNTIIWLILLMIPIMGLWVWISLTHFVDRID